MIDLLLFYFLPRSAAELDLLLLFLPCSADELLLTEMIFNGAFNNLNVHQTTALLSCFVFQEKSNEMPKLTEELSGPLRLMQVC